MGNDNEHDGYEADDEQEIEPLSLVGELRSVLLSAIGIMFLLPGFVEDEIQLASWRRFWLAVVAGTLINFIPFPGSFFYSVSDQSWYITGPLVSCFLWAGAWGVTIQAGLLYLGLYLSHRWIMRQKVDSNPYFIEHAQPLVTVWLSRQVLVTIVSAVVSMFDLSTHPASISMAETAYEFVVLAGFGLTLYFYWISFRALRIVQHGLKGFPLWAAVGILIFTGEVFRTVVASASPAVMVPVIRICFRLAPPSLWL